MGRFFESASKKWFFRTRVQFFKRAFEKKKKNAFFFLRASGFSNARFFFFFCAFFFFFLCVRFPILDLRVFDFRTRVRNLCFFLFLKKLSCIKKKHPRMSSTLQFIYLFVFFLHQRQTPPHSTTLFYLDNYMSKETTGFFFSFSFPFLLLSPLYGNCFVYCGVCVHY